VRTRLHAHRQPNRPWRQSQILFAFGTYSCEKLAVFCDFSTLAGGRMNFNSFAFLLFFAIVFPLYCALSCRWQNRMLLLASYFFYACFGMNAFTLDQFLHHSSVQFLGLILFSTVVDFFIGLRLEANTDDKIRRRWLLLSLVMNLGILGFFKYCNFFIDNARTLLQSVGLQVNAGTLEFMLPYGISFYTFHEISYTMDVYRRERKACHDLGTFAVFIAFFPQLVAGPIGRASNQLPQFEKPRRMTWDGWSQGANLFIIGLFKKMAVADVLSPLVQQVFAEPSHCAPHVLLLGLYGFALQIYADFSGYSDMARGLARAMGFELIENFNHPYFSANITEFWRRWHISLSTWLRDYLYISLGGNRHGEAKTYRNLFLTMFLGGLWHGASWTFVVWGSLHGIYLAVHKLMLGGRKPLEREPKDTARNFVVYLLKMGVTFHLVAFSWIFFASKTFGSAFQFIQGLLGLNPNLATVKPLSFDADSVGLAVAASALLILLVDIPQYMRRDHCVMLRWRFAPRAAVFTLLAMWLIMDRGMRDVPFIYFQF
jgi:D-alanyl-lipoteichoic acid acyltransferase DltB (MBOAT superfamily)